MNTAPIHPAAANAADPPASSPALPTSQGLNTMFLQLLVAQLKNQSPLNPVDPTQFVGQLAQFTELSTVTQIYQLLQQTVGGGTGSKGSASGSSSVGSPSANRSAATAGGNVTIPAATTPNSPAADSNHNFAYPIISADFNKFQGGF